MTDADKIVAFDVLMQAVFVMASIGIVFMIAGLVYSLYRGLRHGYQMLRDRHSPQKQKQANERAYSRLIRKRFDS